MEKDSRSSLLLIIIIKFIFLLTKVFAFLSIFTKQSTFVTLDLNSIYIPIKSLNQFIWWIHLNFLETRDNSFLLNIGILFLYKIILFSIEDLLHPNQDWIHNLFSCYNTHMNIYWFNNICFGTNGIKNKFLIILTFNSSLFF